MTFETLGLPDRHINGIDAVSNPSQSTGDDHLDSLGGAGLQDGPNDHDPAAPHDTALATEAVCSQEGNNSAYETPNVIDAGDDTFHTPIWVIEFLPE